MKNIKDKSWPGYPEGDNKFFARNIAKIGNEFTKTKTEESIRAGKVLQQLAAHMILDGEGYFKAFMNCQQFYEELASDWNEIYVQAGGKVGSGEGVKSPKKELLKKVDGFNPRAFHILQHTNAILGETLNGGNLGTPIPKLERERLYNLHLMLLIVNWSIVMHDKWLERVEKAILQSTTEKERP